MGNHLCRKLRLWEAVIIDTIKIKRKKTKIIAHRGLSGLEAENSAAAFVAAGNRSYFGIETDVHMTADGKFVVIHDENTFRVSGVDKIIEESSYSSLKDIRLLSNDKKTRSDLVIPLLIEYIEICRQYGKTAVLELKAPFNKNQIKKIVDEINKENYIDQTIFISFNWDNLMLIRELLPFAKVQFLVKKFDGALLEKLIKNKIDLDIHYKALSKDTVKTLHKSGIEVNCWTVNSAEEAKRLISYKVDYITTNILE